MSRLIRSLTAALALGFAAPAAAFASDEPLNRISGHVIIVSIDGLRPDAIDRYDARTLERLMREGAYSLSAQTIMPSKTLPSHTSMLTGVEAEEHGITWNSDQTDEHGHVDVPTIFALAHNAGYRTAAFFSKTKFHHLEVPQSLDHVRSPQGGGLLNGRFTWRHTVGMVEDYLESDADAPNLMFVHIGEPDYAGHIFGWMSGIYGLAVKEADKAVAEIIDEANDRFGAGNYTLIVTADHGGHGRDHGSADPRDTTIPWIIWGKGVQPGASLPAIRTMDTAATAMWMLGIATPTDWAGKPVTAAFDNRVLASAQVQ